MRHLLALLALASAPLVGCGKAPEPIATTEEKPAPAPLGIGDPAPPLAAPEWLKGGPVAGFEPGKVYVVEFWATWCGPCIQSMPHLNALAAEHKDAGLRVVAATTKDEQGNTKGAVTEFLAGKAAKYDFAWAFFPTEATYEAYMVAAKQDGIPCSFVVDRAGKIAFIGHPSELDDVLPRVLAGTWKGKADLEAIAKADDELGVLLKRVEQAGEAAKGGGEEAALAAARKAAVGVFDDLAGFEAKHPDKAKMAGYRLQKVAVAMQAGKPDEAKALADPLLAAAVKHEDGGRLGFLATVFASKELNPARKHIGLATAAADGLLKAAGESDLGAVMTAAQAYYAAGDKAKADGYADKARGLATKSTDLRKRVEAALESYRK